MSYYNFFELIRKSGSSCYKCETAGGLKREILGAKSSQRGCYATEINQNMFNLK